MHDREVGGAVYADEWAGRVYADDRETPTFDVMSARSCLPRSFASSMLQTCDNSMLEARDPGSSQQSCSLVNEWSQGAVQQSVNSSEYYEMKQTAQQPQITATQVVVGTIQQLCHAGGGGGVMWSVTLCDGVGQRRGLTSRHTYAPAELYLLYAVPSLGTLDF